MPLFGLNFIADNPDSNEQAGARQGSYSESVAQLPCMPQVVLALIDACGNSDASIANLSSIVRFDPVLSLNMLAMDPAGEQQRFTSLDDAMERIGREAIVGQARSIAFRSHFTSHLDHYKSMPAFAQQSLMRALVARELAENSHYSVPDEAYLAGLLCDVGRLGLGSLNIQQDGMPLLTAEKEHYGTDHIEVGTSLLSFLKQVSFIPDAVRFHHLDINAIEDAHELVKIVYAANALCADPKHATSQPASRIAMLLHCDENTVNDAYQKAGQQLNTLQKQTNIGIGQEQTDRARLALAQKVQQYGMLYAYLSQLLNIHSEQELFAAILKISQTLFKPEKQLLFVVDSVNNTLKGMDPGNENASLVEELKIPLSGGNSFIRKILDEENPVAIACNEFDFNTVIDKQIQGLLNTDRAVYLPLRDADKKTGVMLLGFNNNKNTGKSHNQDLYKLFADDIGRVIESFRTRVNQAFTSTAESVTGSQDAKRLAHEVSTPLSVIKNYLAVLSEKIGSAPSADEDMRIISDEIERVHSIIRQFANGTSSKVGAKEVNVNTVIQDVVKVMHEGFLDSKHVVLKLDLDSSIEPILTNQDALKQILINLIKNAVESIEDSDGRIRIRTRGHIRFDDHNYIEIAVIDNGPGIPAEIFEQLFNKVQSTKGGEHGGLGLSIVHSLVKEMNGKISCRTMNNKGTIFHILLPKEIQT